MARVEALLERYRAVRGQTKALYEPLSVEDLVVQSMPDASPLKWHLAHTTWFFDTFVAGPGGEVVGSDAYRHLFNSYYETVGEPFPRPLRGTLSRPTVAEVEEYRRLVDEAVPRVLEAAARDEARLAPLLHALEIGIHHEQQHQELMLTDVKHALGSNPLRPAYDATLRWAPAEASEMRMVRFEGGVREVGFEGEGFAFDNERPRHRVFLDDFGLASRLVTNGEYAEFVEDGGYRSPVLWLDAGWAWVREEGIEAPLYWERDRGYSYTLGGVRPLDAHAPVCHVSFFEADAYARWAGKRLPSEAEWEVVAATVREPSRGTLLEDGALHPVGRSAGGELLHLFGEVWEHTSSPYRPYPGFSPLDGSLGEYNGKFMSGQMVLRGASCATPKSHLRTTYRNFFAPQKRWQFSGFRLAE